MPRPKGGKRAVQTAGSTKESKRIKNSKETKSESNVNETFEDEIEGIQQFLNETEKENVKDDELQDELDSEVPTSELKHDTKPIEEKENKLIKCETDSEQDDEKSSGEITFDESKFSQVQGIENATEGRCGHCEGCTRSPCQECSACKRHDYDECIDLYCINEKSGLSERAALREMYIKAMRRQNEERFKERSSEGEDSDGNAYSDDNGKDSKKFSSVYGGSSRAAKLRRCGECEGCTRDDCGQCVACLDKPRFGGKGSKKKACLERYCRMKVVKN